MMSEDSLWISGIRKERERWRKMRTRRTKDRRRNRKERNGKVVTKNNRRVEYVPHSHS